MWPISSLASGGNRFLGLRHEKKSHYGQHKKRMLKKLI
jgi:hypothetical protein